MVLNACTNAVFLALGIFCKCIANAFSSTGFRDVVELGAPPFDVVEESGDGEGEGEDDVRCVGGGGIPQDEAERVAFGASNVRTRFRKRSRLLIVWKVRRIGDNARCLVQCSVCTNVDYLAFARGLRSRGVAPRLSWLRWIALQGSSEQLPWEHVCHDQSWM